MSELAPYQRRIPRERRNGRLIVWMLLFFLALAAAFFFQSPYSKVQSAEVMGAELLQVQEIRERLQLVGQPSVLLLRPHRMERTLLKDPVIKDARVDYIFPNEVKVSITEYRPVAFLSEGKERLILLENGTVIPVQEQEIPPLLPWVQAPLHWEPLSYLGAELTLLPDEILSSIVLIRPAEEASDPQQVVLNMKEGYEVYLTIPKMKQKMSYYPDMVRYLQRMDKMNGQLFLTEETAWYEAPEGEGAEQ